MRFFCLIFVISLLIRMWFNCFACDQSVAFACDASEYLRDAQNLLLTFNNIWNSFPNSLTACLNVLLGLAHGDETNMVKHFFVPLQSMDISGPVFPIFILTCFKFFGQNPSAEFWLAPVLAQCVLSSLTCVLISAIGYSCWNRTVGILSGLIAAFYPGFIINSGRLYSESFASFSLSLIIWLIVNYLLKSRNGPIWGFILGISLFALQTTRSIMTILSIIIIAFVIISGILLVDQKKQMAKYLAAVFIGFLLCLLPWLVMQQLAFGKTSFVVDRVGQYNFFVGNDVNELGWLSIPYPDLNGLQNKKYTTILKQSVEKSPERFLKLLMDKPARLFKLPWNDFKVNIGPISVYQQTLFHQLILIFAGVGILTGFSSHYKSQRSQLLAKTILLFVGLFHLVYLFFITVPRYNLTALPEIILFCAAGLASIISACSIRSIRKTAFKTVVIISVLLLFSQFNILSIAAKLNDSVGEIHFWLFMNVVLKMALLFLSLFYCWQLIRRPLSNIQRVYAFVATCLIALFAIPAYCLPIRAHGRWYEWSENLKGTKTTFEKIVTLNQNQIHRLKDSPSYLAINIAGGSNLVTDWEVSINQHRLTGPFIPAMALAQDLTLIHKNNNNYFIEQEFILQNLCRVSGLSPLDLRQWYLIPIDTKELQLENTTANIRITITKNKEDNSTIFGTYNLNQNFSIIPSFFRFSWEKAFYGVENQAGLSDPSYDQKIDISQNTNVAGPYIKLLIPAISANKQDNKDQLNLSRIHQTSNLLNKEFTINFKPDLKSILAERKFNPFWLVRFSGQIQNKKNDNHEKLTVWTSLNFSNANFKISNKNNFYYISPWLPDRLNYPTEEKGQPLHFDICFPILINAIDDHLNDIELHVLSNSNGKIKIDCLLQIYPMSKLPSEIQYEIL